MLTTIQEQNLGIGNMKTKSNLTLKIKKKRKKTCFQVPENLKPTTKNKCFAHSYYYKKGAGELIPRGYAYSEIQNRKAKDHRNH